MPDQLIDTLRSARRITALTGAGVSAESGIPTFRQAQTGLWAQYDPTELATPQAFQRDPRLVWEWYTWRRELVAGAHPNPGHTALAAIESIVSEFALITQNVDGLHRQAGSQNIVELHGNIIRSKCFDEDVVIESWPSTDQVPPPCPRCGAHLRPDVVWFGEGLPEHDLAAALHASRNTDVFLSIGTSALVQPAASLPLYALQAGVVLIEINPQDTPLTSSASYVLSGPAGEVLPQLVAQVWPN
ncbi:MAG: NAD-dependent deacylase [Anaerolineae bacterium]|nr:NAD-dependent deacylase [Anaerolineae bacterium]